MQLTSVQKELTEVCLHYSLDTEPVTKLYYFVPSSCSIANQALNCILHNTHKKAQNTPQACKLYVVNQSCFIFSPINVCHSRMYDCKTPWRWPHRETSWLQSSLNVTTDDAAPTCRKTPTHWVIVQSDDLGVLPLHFIDELLIVVMFPVKV